MNKFWNCVVLLFLFSHATFVHCETTVADVGVGDGKEPDPEDTDDPFDNPHLMPKDRPTVSNNDAVKRYLAKLTEGKPDLAAGPTSPLNDKRKDGSKAKMGDKVSVLIDQDGANVRDLASSVGAVMDEIAAGAGSEHINSGVVQALFLHAMTDATRKADHHTKDTTMIGVKQFLFGKPGEQSAGFLTSQGFK